MRKFKPGDLAIVLPHDGVIPAGEIVECVRYDGDYERDHGNVKDSWLVKWGNGRKDREYRISEPLLKPLYDGNQKSSWDDCVWKPKEREEVTDEEGSRIAVSRWNSAGARPNILQKCR